MCHGTLPLRLVAYSCLTNPLCIVNLINENQFVLIFRISHQVNSSKSTNSIICLDSDLIKKNPVRILVAIPLIAGLNYGIHGHRRMPGLKQTSVVAQISALDVKTNGLC